MSGFGAGLLNGIGAGMNRQIDRNALQGAGAAAGAAGAAKPGAIEARPIGILDRLRGALGGVGEAASAKPALEGAAPSAPAVSGPQLPVPGLSTAAPQVQPPGMDQHQALLAGYFTGDVASPGGYESFGWFRNRGRQMRDQMAKERDG